jgi:hypothetical protein
MSKLQWRPQDVEEVRSPKCLLRKTISSEWSQPTREDIWTTNNKAQGFPSLLDLTT